MDILSIVLLLFVIICAISVSVTKNLLTAVVIFMSQSLVMSIIWILLESPDLAITEAAVGAGVTSLLFFVTLKKIHAMKEEGEADDYEGEGDEDVGDAHEAVEAHEGVVGPNAFDGFVSDEECAMVSSP